MDYGSYGHLLFERREHGVLLITLNRPEVYNAADEAMHSQLARVWIEVARDDQTRVAVVTGAGEGVPAGGAPARGGREAGEYDPPPPKTGKKRESVENKKQC